MIYWEQFFRDRVRKIFEEKKYVVDIGGGLRVAKEKNNRYSKANEWIRPLMERVDYKVLDPVATYNPDIVGDIHKLPMSEGSVDAFICIAVLEHVENPILAASEMHRALKRGGYAYVYVPFLYYYHPMKGYYGDYWRFTPDSLKFIFKDFSSVEIVNVRGAVETLVKLSPLGRYPIFLKLARVVDIAAGKVGSKQTSGYNVFLVK